MQQSAVMHIQAHKMNERIETLKESALLLQELNKPINNAHNASEIF